MLIVEAKAHENEMHRVGKPSPVPIGTAFAILDDWLTYAERTMA